MTHLFLEPLFPLTLCAEPCTTWCTGQSVCLRQARLDVQRLMAWANVRTFTLSAPPLSNAFEHSLTVAPVV
jgi:hypothetical protein